MAQRDIVIFIPGIPRLGTRIAIEMSSMPDSVRSSNIAYEEGTRFALMCWHTVHYTFVDGVESTWRRLRAQTATRDSINELLPLHKRI